MTRKFKNSLSLLLVLVFFLPTIVKLEHHHEHTECTAHRQAAHYHEYHGNCAICEFEFSFFLADPCEVAFQEENPAGSFFNHYESPDYSTLSQFSFLLRGPPTAANRV